MSDTIYVDKKHYDALLKAYGREKTQNIELTKRLDIFRQMINQFNDRVLEDIHRFKTLEEESAYLTGAYNTLLALRYNLEDLEVIQNVQAHLKQNPL